ncbi:hypothetical protein AKJ16_DCAP05351 [Drosera capensis]
MIVISRMWITACTLFLKLGNQILKFLGMNISIHISSSQLATERLFSLRGNRMVNIKSIVSLLTIESNPQVGHT